MNITESINKIETRLSGILEKAKSEGLYAKMNIRTLGKDFLTEQADEKKIRFISAEVIISASESGKDCLSFGVAVECKKGYCDEAATEEDIIFAEERADEFFSELASAENKEAFIINRASEEEELRLQAAEEIRKTVRASWIGGIAAVCVGLAVLVIAAVIMIAVL